jgi:hypothetical protein
MSIGSPRAHGVLSDPRTGVKVWFVVIAVGIPWAFLVTPKILITWLVDPDPIKIAAVLLAIATA